MIEPRQGTPRRDRRAIPHAPASTAPAATRCYHGAPHRPLFRDNDTMRRTFIVGCPRSGTTVVQAMLARHPDVLTLPETALFEHLLGGLDWRWGDRGARRPRQRAAHRLGFARRRGREAFRESLRRIGHMDARARAPLRTANCVSRFVATLDDAARAAGRGMWLEKTPNHLLYVPEIVRHLPDARFVHVIRPGVDVLASIADANLRFDDNHAFGGDAKQWAQRWNRAIDIHRRYVDRPGHHFVFLDDFVADTPVRWRALCLALGLDPDAPLADTCAQPVADLAEEPWKHAAVAGRPRPPRPKVDALFGPALRHWLDQRLVPLAPLRAACVERDADSATPPAGPAAAGGPDASCIGDASPAPAPSAR